MRIEAVGKPAKRAVNLSLSADLVARARAEGLNLSGLAEAAVAAALAERAAEKLKSEIARSCEAYDRFYAEYGSLAEAVWAEADGGA